MKIKPKIKLVKKAMKPETEEIEAAVEVMEENEQSINQFNACMDSLNGELVGRTEEIKCLKLAMVARHNLMLVGPKGNAKTMLAEHAFARVEGANYYGRQFMKGTLVDEVFGPMRTKLYKEKEQFEYNTTGMLPEAHFALCDEIYRAPDSLLDSALRILNEKRYFSGTRNVECPLITAMGTTNFITDSEELDAFHDRWLIRIGVGYLDSETDIMEMLTRFTSNEEKVEPPKMPLDTVQELIAAAKKIPFPEETLKLYHQLSAGYISRLGVPRKISDRRICQSLSLVRASYLLDEDRAPEIEPGYLAAAKYGLCQIGAESAAATESAAFTESYEKVIGTYIRETKSVQGFKKLLSAVKMMASEFDPSMTKQQTVDMYIKVNQYHNTLENLPSDKIPTTQKAIEVLNNLRQEVAVLKDSLEENVDHALLKKRVAFLVEEERQKAAKAAGIPE